MQPRAKTTVLVVDDDASTRFVLSRSLEGLGMRVVAADDGTEVPSMIARERFDLLVLDLYMPGMNGFELMRQIRRPAAGLLPLPKTPADVPIVVVSGESDPDSISHVKSLGAALHLPKPIDLEQFEEAIQSVLRKHSSPSARTRKTPSS